MNTLTTRDRLVEKNVCIVNSDEFPRLRIAALYCLSLVLLIAGAPILAINVFAPVAYGPASSSSDAVGSVTDSTGASIASVVVRLNNNATGAERQTTTNESGEWSVPNPSPGSYRLRVERPGFKTSHYITSTFQPSGGNWL
jgi:hypothetical protein